MLSKVGLCVIDLADQQKLTVVPVV